MGVEHESDVAVEEKAEELTSQQTPALQRSSKKRTKTGCITCRKRRIKCGEERPICKNCIKSKRECGGYIQPVVFKQPNGDVRIPGSDPGGLYHGTFGGGSMGPFGQQPYDLNGPYPQPQYFAEYSSLGGHDPPPGFLPSHPAGNVMYQPERSNFWTGLPDTFDHGQTQHSSWDQYPLQPRYSGTQRSYSASYAVGTDYLADTRSFPPQGSTQYNATGLGSQQALPHFHQPSLPNALLQRAQTEFHAPQFDWQPTFQKPSLSRLPTAPIFPSQSEAVKPQVDTEARRYSVHGFLQRQSFNTGSPTSAGEKVPAPTLPFAPAEEEDYDPYDIEMELNEKTADSMIDTQRELSGLLVRYAAHDKSRLRTFTTFLDNPGVLSTYRPTHSASPLYDEKVARIFCHFISVMGPCISVFERQASNSPITFSNVAVPSSQKMLWSYTMPSMALQNTALLHALLALSSLHIAKLQETSEDPSLKHFTYAVRRVSKLLSLPNRRHEIATLATILLLGFYEVLSADHSRWSLHLAGAKDLVMEFDFVRKARTIRRMRDQAKANFAQRYASSYEEHVQIAGIPEALLSDVDWEVDESLITKLTGLHVQYSEPWAGSVPQKRVAGDLTEKDIDDFKTKSDLRWWYCKQDIFQGMVSGDPLLMPYEQWVLCPPRGQIGKLEAAYASMDYLCLIMARLIDFGGKDRFRKQKVVKAQGGHWRPTPGLFSNDRKDSPNGVTDKNRTNSTTAGYVPNGTHGVVPVASSAEVQTAPSAPNRHFSIPSSAMPPMYGMMPLPTEPPEMHSAYQMMAANIHDPAFTEPIPPPDQKASASLEAETDAALAEHAAIESAFDTFVQLLGPEFHALPVDSTPLISTPFGPALQYRTYTIACIWAFYYVGRILIHRMHPHMPPAAMVAVGIAAAQTKEYSQLVGRICAGLYFPQQYTLQSGLLNPHLGAALIESTFTLLFAGIQYQDAAQRGWTINKLNVISKMTGWQTSASVAAACEVAWQKMAMAGRGPPYEPTMDRNNKDVRVRAIFTPNSSPGDVPKPDPIQDTKDEPAFLSHDRELIDRNPASRVHWALGLLSVEEDIAKLSLNKK